MEIPEADRDSAEGIMPGDEVLIRECLLGSELAWSKLIRKYANLIFSIPVRRGFGPDDSADIFQSVCTALLSSLRNIREPRALAAWVIQTTAHACDRYQMRQSKSASMVPDGHWAARYEDMPDELVAQLEREQLVREAIATLNPECQKLIELLFLTDPPLPYEKAAAELALAKGSIGATRMRCLEKLRLMLEQKGFR